MMSQGIKGDNKYRTGPETHHREILQEKVQFHKLAYLDS